MRLADMGTTGLIEWVVSGNRRLMGARCAKAKRIIAIRTKQWKAVNAFNNAVNAAYLRKIK